MIASGTTVPVLGALGAEILVLAGRCREETVWFVVSATDAGVERLGEEGVDLTRDVGRVRLSEKRIPAQNILGARVDEIAALNAVLQCAEAVGVARWAQETSLAYAKIREQFGRPIGSFQAIKHKCAQLFIRVEVMTNSAWDAAVAADGDDRQQIALTAARTATVVRREAVDVVLEHSPSSAVSATPGNTTSTCTGAASSACSHSADHRTNGPAGRASWR